jgi:hypothetical protein
MEDALGVLRRGFRPAACVVDDDHAGPDWARRLAAAHGGRLPAVRLTFAPSAVSEPGIVVLSKPFPAKALLDALDAVTGPPVGTVPPRIRGPFHE